MKLVKTAAMTAAAVGDSPLFVLDYALRLLRVLVLLALWRVILSGNPRGEVMSLGAVLTYTLMAEAFNDQLAVQTTIADTFWEGTIVLRFLRPIGLVLQFVAEMAGRWVIHFALFSIPLLLVAPLLGVDPRPASAMAGLLFVLSLGLGIVVGLALDFLFATATVALEQPVWLVQSTRSAVAVLLSGSLLPLAYYPWGIGEVFSWLPFASMAWAPLAIYTGVGDPPRLLALQLLWAIVLWPIAGWLWQANREKVIGYGG
ncbi:MAG TPA: ABC-2 family transporter protein [Chloroflexota bacterium]|jgi:ABC-2 type transport system permease protein